MTLRIDSGTHPNIALREKGRLSVSQRSHPTRKHARAVSAGAHRNIGSLSDEGYRAWERLLARVGVRLPS